MIRIDNDLIIDIDNENYIAKLEKHRKDKNGVEITDVIGYYTTLNSALKGILRWKVANSLTNGEKSLHEAICTVEACVNEFGEKVDKAIGDN